MTAFRISGIPIAVVFLIVAIQVRADLPLTFRGYVEDDVGFDGVAAVAVSPDSRYVYVTSSQDDALTVLEREASGLLRLLQVVRDGDQSGEIDGLDDAKAVAVSADGRHLYAAGGGDNAVAVFARDAEHGGLTFIEVSRDGGLNGLNAIAVTPEGSHVIAVSTTDEAVVVFSRDRATGKLSFLQSLRDGQQGVDGLSSATWLAISPDGNNVYVAARYDDHAVTVFGRDIGTGRLTFLETHKDEEGIAELRGSNSVVVSPDGDQVYSVGDFGTIVIFDRIPGAGTLRFREQQTLPRRSCGGCARSLAVDPFGDNLYVVGVGIHQSELGVFARDSASGALAFLDHATFSTDGADHRPGTPVVSPDGEYVYVSDGPGEGGLDLAGGLIVLVREPLDGTLDLTQILRRGVGPNDGLDSASMVASSPDGLHLYVVSQSEGSVAVFARDPADDAPEFLQVVRDGENGADGLAGATAVALSADGQHVYVTGRADNALVVFARDGATGLLRLVQIERDRVDGVTGLSAASSVVVSPDGAHVYVTSGIHRHSCSSYSYGDTSPGAPSMAIFSRDAGSGALSFVDSLENGFDGVDTPTSVTTSPNGEHVYVTAIGSSSLAVFARDAETGLLQLVDYEQDGVDGADGLEAPVSAVVSPDGRHVYVTALHDGPGDERGFRGAVGVFARDADSGELSFVEAVRSFDGGTTDTSGPVLSLAVSHDGQQVFATVASGFLDTIGVFQRDQETGRLEFSQAETQGFGDIVTGIGGASSVVVSPDDQHLYVTGPCDDAMAYFSIGGGPPIPTPSTTPLPTLTATVAPSATATDPPTLTASPAPPLAGEDDNSGCAIVAPKRDRSPAGFLIATFALLVGGLRRRRSHTRATHTGDVP